jgi:hypothetical protein
VHISCGKNGENYGYFGDLEDPLGPPGFRPWQVQQAELALLLLADGISNQVPLAMAGSSPNYLWTWKTTEFLVDSCYLSNDCGTQV